MASRFGAVPVEQQRQVSRFGATPVDADPRVASPPEGAVPGSRQYADWAAEQARAGRRLPQVSDPNYGAPQGSLLDPLVQGTTMGWGDELRGAVQGGIAAAQGGDFWRAYDQVVDESRQSLEHQRRTNPVGSIAAEIVGAIPTSLVAGGQLAGRGASALARGISGFGVGLGQGAAYGAGAADGDEADRAQGAVAGGLLGGAAGAAVPAIVAGARNLVASPTKAAVQSAPDAAAIKAVGQAGYQAAEASGVGITPQASNLLMSDLNALLQRKGLIMPNGKLPDGTGRIRRVLKQLEQYAQAPMSMPQFQRLRESIAEVAASPKAGQGAIGAEMLDVFDGFADSLPQQAFTAPKGTDAIGAWSQAKTDWARYKRTKSIEDAIYNAQNSVGGDFATRMRSAVGTLLKKHRKRSQGFDPTEIAAMEKFVQGGGIGDLMQTLAQGGLLNSLAGGLTAGPIGAAAGAGVSLGSRAFLDGAAGSAANRLRAQVATPGGLQPHGAGDFERYLARLGIGGAQPALGEPRDFLTELMFGR